MTIKEVSEKYGISQDTLRYYEKVNVIPKVTRTSGGIRDYQEEDLRWVELAVCMRNAGLPIESLIEYQRLFRAGDSTIPARLELLNEQMDILQKQKDQFSANIWVPLCCHPLFGDVNQRKGGKRNNLSQTCKHELAETVFNSISYS